MSGWKSEWRGIGRRRFIYKGLKERRERGGRERRQRVNSRGFLLADLTTASTVVFSSSPVEVLVA